MRVYNSHMTRAKILTPSIIVLVLVGIVIAVLLFFAQKQRTLTGQYTCYDRGVPHEVRCKNANDTEQKCYGYYHLQGKNIEDGIRVTSSDSPSGTTCEGFLPGNEIYFDSKGEFIGRN